MTIKHVITTLCVFATLLTTSVHAAVIDFEDIDVGTPDVSTCAPNSAIVSGNFSFSSDFEHCVTNGQQIANIPDNGTQFLLEGGDLLRIAPLNGLLFSVSSLDLSESLFAGGISVIIDVIGRTVSDGDISVRLTLDGAFRTYDLENFKSLTELFISRVELSPSETGPGYFNLDNLVFELEEEMEVPLPLPATLPLSMLALAGVAAVRRRR